MALRLGAAAAALLLAGCAGQVQTSGGDAATFYSRSVVGHASAGGSFPLVVHGSPFAGMPPERSARAVASQMRLPGWFPQVPFELAPGASGDDYRLVLIFNPARPVSSREACGDLRGTPVAPPGPEVRVKAAFCAGPDWASDATGRAPAAPPGSPAFRQLLDQLAIAVFPPENPVIDDEERLPRGPKFLRRRG